MILFENSLTYVALAKGPLVDHHFLIIPKRHVKSYSELSETEESEINISLMKLRYNDTENSMILKMRVGFNLKDV